GIVYRDDYSFEENIFKFYPSKLEKKKKIKPKLDLSSEKIKEIRLKRRNFIYDKTNKNNTTYLPAPEDETEGDFHIFPAPPTRKALGNIRGLVIIVDFPDAPATLPIEEYDRWFNDMNYSNFGNNGSVRKYFYDISGGKLDYQGVVFGIFRATNTFAYYDSLPYGEGVRQILSWVLPLIDRQGFDFSTLSTDSNNRILAINLVYTGNPRTWAQGMWYHQGSYTRFSADGVRSWLYATMSANSPLTIATACHENGHMVCGWPDLYKYDSSSGPDGIGRFCLMCNTGSSTNPVPPNPYFIYTVGWGTLVNVNDWGARIIFDISNDLIFYRYMNLNNPREFYIFASMRRVFRHSNIPDEGLTIWRIDEDGDNQTTRHMVNLIHANNNINDHTRACFRRDRGYDKYNDYTTPPAAWYNGTPTFLNCFEISNPASTMTYRIVDNNKEWYFLTGQEGWSLANNLSGNVVNGIFILNIISSSAYMLSPNNLGISASTFTCIRIRMKSNTNGNLAKIYWITTTDTQWNETKCVTFLVSSNDNSFKEYVINLSTNTSWRGTIRQIRFDLPGSSGTVELDYIKLERDFGVLPSCVYLVRCKSSMRYMTVESLDSNTTLQQKSFTGTLGQFWRIEDLGDNYYRFVSLRSSMCATVENNSITSGASIIQLPWNPSQDNQKFKIDSVEKGYYRISARHSGKVVAVESNNEEEIIKQFDWLASSDTQKWSFILQETQNFYTLVVNVNPNGIGRVILNPTGGVYLHGSTVTLTAISNFSDYRFSHWSGDVFGRENPLVLFMNSNKSITANFVRSTYTLVINVLPSAEAGMIEVDPPPIDGVYIGGTTVTLKAVPHRGWEFLDWSLDGIKLGVNPLVIIMDKNYNIFANFKASTYSISVMIEPEQAMSNLEIIPHKSYYIYGESVTVRVTLKEGWEFIGWTGDIGGNDNPLNLIIYENYYIVGMCRLSTYTVNIIIEPPEAGEVKKEPNYEEYVYGSKVKITAESYEGWRFDRWEGDIISTSSILEVEIKKNINILAKFTPSLHKFNVEIIPSSDVAKVEIFPYEEYYVYNTTVAISIYPNEGWFFEGWFLEGEILSTERSIEYSIKKDIILKAHLRPTTHTVTINLYPEEAGKVIFIEPHSERPYYEYGTKLILQAIANIGWKFVGWSEEDLISTESVIELLIKKDTIISALFKKSTYTIVIDILPVGAGDVLKFPDLDYYTYGSTVTLLVVPNKKFEFEGWYGDIVSKEKKITVEITNNKFIQAKFYQLKDFFLSLNNDNINEIIYLVDDIESIEIFDHKGRLMYSLNSNSLKEILDKNFMTGFYILKLKFKNGNIKYEKLIVTK
ncbi:MAG: M6 family metalloprotease domain-containing protein, partial [Elusimicrobiota bacterium]|nr:M6 family metalloprotease domain-containing protein [Endomicrobiia bacterium]MDW8166180.1 M6 family metalloprotease domain-containing protein [Elusimicrobiota bacterium]